MRKSGVRTMRERVRSGGRWFGVLGAPALLAAGCLAPRALLAQGTDPAQASIGAGASGADAAQSGVAVRAARLTYLAEGVITVEHEGLPDTEIGQQNMPIAQGSRLTSNEKGQAEVEFEDGSVIRLTPNSALSLESLGNSGKTAVTVVRILRGLVYCELRASALTRFSVLAGGETFWPVENTTVRVNLDEPPAVFSVLLGKILVEHVSRPGPVSDDAPQAIDGYRTEVHAGESLRSDAANASRYFLTESIPPETWDNWNEERDQAAADAVASATDVRNRFAGSQGYGWSDLDADGTWYAQQEQPGQPPVWQPGEALAAGFDPYGYGSWTYVPGAGYSWASGYAWGWTPYRCGNWRYWDQFGWGWQPDSACGSNYIYGAGGGNAGRGPKGYVPVTLPVRHPQRPHPILPGPNHGPHPPYTRAPVDHREAQERFLANSAVQPILPSGHGFTTRGGSAVGSALRSDYAVDALTRRPVDGVAPEPTPAARAYSVQGWRAVSARPDPPASGGLRGLFGRTSHTDASPVKIDAHGNPYAPAVRPVGNVSSGAARAEGNTSRSGQAMQTNAHAQAGSAPNSHPQASAPAASHAAPAAAPAAAAPAAATHK